MKQIKNEKVEINGKPGECTGFSPVMNCYYFSMYDGGTIKLSYTEVVDLFGLDFAARNKFEAGEL